MELSCLYLEFTILRHLLDLESEQCVADSATLIYLFFPVYLKMHRGKKYVSVIKAKE